ncbi:MAG: hypothetical protein FJW39_20155 [Acidobacteria bacterium]|nr:hypothetical protein [Acidobacteriota bacterium]
MRLLTGLLLAAPFAFCEVTAVHVIERSDVLGETSFGSAGPYERIIAKAHFAVDPKVAANRIISDIDLAPVNQDGHVEFAADIYVLKPREPKRGNGTVLFEVSNRGNKGMMSMFQMGGGGLDPRNPNDFGDRMLLESGYTLVWIGWQFDVPDGPDKVRLYAPIARQAGKEILGLVRAEMTTDSRQSVISLGDRDHMAYPAIEPIKMTVRDRCDAPRTAVPAQAWKLVDGNTHVRMEAGFEPGRIYELVYRAKDPVLVGLGPAAVRDFISYLKYGATRGSINVFGDHRGVIKRAIAFGTSQSGRFLRTYLYFGFNRDEKDRKVFDGVWAHVAGGGRGSFNHRFAQPSRDGHPHLNCGYPTDIFPFTDVEQTDPSTGMKGGILTQTLADKVAPKVFYTNSSYEYWGRAAALTHSSVDGREDVPPPADSRSYLFAGTTHGPGSFPPGKGAAENTDNGNDYRWMMRGLLTAMNAWITDGKEPPASQIPMVSRDQLVSVSALNWPKIPSSRVPQRPQRAYRADYGPDFRTKGLVTKEPPDLGQPFAALVPQVDIDGNETAGIRAPVIAVPLATMAGWNMRTAKIGAQDEIYNMKGSTWYLPRTKAEKAKTRDPRQSIEERYAGKQDYVAKFRAAAQELASRGYLLQADVDKLAEQGAKHWDAVMKR